MIGKKRSRNNKGIIVSDAIIAILIILLFSGIIISLITNIILESKKMGVNSQEIDYVTDIFEYSDSISYDQVTTTNLIQYINNKDFDGVSAGTNIENLTTAYRIQIDVQNYNDTTGNTEKIDLIKIIHVKIGYNLGQKEYTYEVSKIRARTENEVIELCNN